MQNILFNELNLQEFKVSLIAHFLQKPLQG